MPAPVPLGTRRIMALGYVRIKLTHDHHLCQDRHRPGWAYEHLLVMEKKLGRRLQSGELVHHHDGNKSNNEPENLELTTRRDHMNHHRDVVRQPIRWVCPRGHVKSRLDRNGYPICQTCKNDQKRQKRQEARQHDATV